jgi:hypothetical protein
VQFTWAKARDAAKNERGARKRGRKFFIIVIPLVIRLSVLAFIK